MINNIPNIIVGKKMVKWFSPPIVLCKSNDPPKDYVIDSISIINFHIELH